MHQSEILVQMGDRVEQGQLIGLVGNTGRVEGPHLHFEVLVGSVQVNPLEWLNQVFP
jgi:murein DD-endopeptidase MepM/ murein hydrolase activator NlpD